MPQMTLIASRPTFASEFSAITCSPFSSKLLEDDNAIQNIRTRRMVFGNMLVGLTDKQKIAKASDSEATCQS